MEKIKMVDLNLQYERIKPEIDAAIQDVLNSTAFIQGPQVAEFANALKEYTDAKYVITCANGTDALQIAMMALSFKPGDEIILPVHTYVATAEVIALLGLTPVFVDVDEKSFNIDVDQIKNKITKKTVAIVPVHLYGQCANLEAIMKIAGEHNLHVIEDAAQSLSADYIFSNGTKKKGGTIGTIGTTSFFPSKNLGCYGDGGAIFTNDSSLADTIKMMANHGQKVKYHHDSIGVNSRLDTLQAAILKVKLKYLNEYTQKRNEVAAYYDKTLASIKQFILPHRVSYSTHAFHQYTIQVQEIDRDEFKLYLDKCGIPSMIYYPVPLHLQKAYRQPGAEWGAFPITEKLSKTVLSLPIHTEMNEEQLNYICTIIRNYF
ncbi:MAG TPA: DegT/DnrJ/EryC1/StrS family aminotransferase [Cyclobacteriaceae bacterium]|nr:DegT/DnrJ/EryC1/StrS family aminotransferase [Cyclobacteriaceae bacterium]